MRVGIQLTSNPQQYEFLLSLIQSELSNKINIDFIHISSENKLRTELPNLDILTCYNITPKSFSYSSNKLKWIHIGAAGVEESLFPELLKSKTIITNASGIHAGPVSEFTMGMILYMVKQFRGCNQFMSDKIWTQWELAKNISQLKGKTIGIIGFGSIGKAIAKKAKAFEMQVISTRRLQKKVEQKKIVDELIPLSDLDHLLSNSNFIVVACPLTPMTNGMIGKKEISKITKSAYLINIARGEIIKENALINALQKKSIAGAALDVYKDEPLQKDHPLFKLDNVFLSPHIAGNFRKYQNDVALQFTNNLNRYLTGKNLINRVCKKRLY